MSAPNHVSSSRTEELKATHKEYSWACATAYYEEPIALTHGLGMEVWDADDNRYLDCFGGVLTTSVGHARPEVVKAVSEQVAKIAHTSTLYLNEQTIGLAEKMAQITPGRLKKSFFTNSGTEADETAMVLARIYTGNTEIIALRHGYHGRSVMNMTATGHAPWKHGTSLVPGIVHAHAPYCYRCPFNASPDSCALECARDVEELIQTSTTGQVAAFIAEPIMGVGGFITPPKEYFKVVTDIVRRYGGIFICDEVQTGWGRTGGKWFGIEQYGVTPDIITSAKGLGNGFPIGLTVAKPEIADAMKGATISTFGGNPMAATAGKAVLDYIEEQNLRVNAAEVGAHLRHRLLELQDKHPLIGEVRGMGLMQGIELVQDRKTKVPAAAETAQMMEATRENRILLGKGGLYGNVLRISPPLNISKTDVDEFAGLLDRSFAQVRSAASVS